MYGNYFFYNGQTSQDYGLMIGGYNLDTDVPLGMNREILRGSMNRYRITPNHMGTAYQEPLVFTISMVKDQCSSADEYVFTEDEVDAIVSWLTEPQYPTLFHMYDEEPDVYKKYDYFGLFSDIQTITNNEEVIGFTMTFTTNSPYAWGPEKTFTYTYSPDNEVFEESSIPVPVEPIPWDDDIPIKSVKAASATPDEYIPRVFTINVDTSERNSPVWPIITIEPNIDASSPGGNVVRSSSSVSNIRIPIIILNLRDGNPYEVEYPEYPKALQLYLTKFKHTIDCRRTMITGPEGLADFEDIMEPGIIDYYGIYWPRLYHGENKLVIMGPATITFTFREPRKVGAY